MGSAPILGPNAFLGSHIHIGVQATQGRAWGTHSTTFGYAHKGEPHMSNFWKGWHCTSTYVFLDVSYHNKFKQDLGLGFNR